MMWSDYFLLIKNSEKMVWKMDVERTHDEASCLIVLFYFI